jgi:hypothetical protein
MKVTGGMAAMAAPAVDDVEVLTEWSDTVSYRCSALNDF